MPTYRIVIGERELDVKAPDLEAACKAASAHYPGELISGFYAIPEIEGIEEPSEEASEDGEDEDHGN